MLNSNVGYGNVEHVNVERDNTGNYGPLTYSNIYR